MDKFWGKLKHAVLAILGLIAPLSSAASIELCDIPFLDAEGLVTAAKDSYKIGNNGLIEFDERGFPDRLTYSALRQAAKLNSRQEPGGPDRRELERLSRAYYDTRAFIFSGDNAKLQSTVFSEIVPNGVSQNLYNFVSSRRYEVGIWWMRMDQNYDFYRQNKAPLDITYNSSRSTILKQIGPGSGSFIYWPVLRTLFTPAGKTVRQPTLLAPHIRVNTDKDGVERSLEMIAPVGRELLGLGPVVWNSFLFEKLEDEWIPQVKSFNRKESLVCLNCHYSLNFRGQKRLSPKPFFLNTMEDFERVGYKDRSVIEQYRRQFPTH